MALTIPPDLLAALEELARRRHTDTEKLLRTALEEYLKLEKDLDEELATWQAGAEELHAKGEEGPARGDEEDDDS
jgi:predicted transcriptional regulator